MPTIATIPTQPTPPDDGIASDNDNDSGHDDDTEPPAPRPTLLPPDYFPTTTRFPSYNNYAYPGYSGYSLSPQLSSPQIYSQAPMSGHVYYPSQSSFVPQASFAQAPRSNFVSYPIPAARPRAYQAPFVTQSSFVPQGSFTSMSYPAASPQAFVRG